MEIELLQMETGWNGKRRGQKRIKKNYVYVPTPINKSNFWVLQTCIIKNKMFLKIGIVNVLNKFF